MSGQLMCDDCGTALHAENPSALGFMKFGLPLVHCKVCDCLANMTDPFHVPPADMARPPAWM